MVTLRLSIFVAFAITGAVAPIHSKMCHVCDGVRDPSTCTGFKKCHPDEACFTDVTFHNGEYLYFRGCKKHHECPAGQIIGKRGAHEDKREIVCVDCCFTNMCNNVGCDQYASQTTTMTLPTTPAMSSPQTTSGGTSSSCVDHEEDGFSCTAYDQYNFCAETDTSSISYNIAHNKCPKHCGFCPTTTVAPSVPAVTQSGPCRDHEEDGFKCADYDQYNFCTDISSIAYIFAHQKCPKHCGYCQTSGGSVTSSSASSQVTLTSTHQASGTVTPGFANSFVSQAQTTTAKPCADFEDATFSCASWASNGFCQSATGVLHEITVMRCSKYCKLC